MNIHEYQAKHILSQFGARIPMGRVAYTPKEACLVARDISESGPWMLKAQIHAGARRNGYFLEKNAGNSGGIRVVKSYKNIEIEAQKMLNNTLVTIQTGPKGKKVNKIYVEAFEKVYKKFYLAITIDRITADLTLLIADYSDGDIIKLAINNPELILHIKLDLYKDINSSEVNEIIQFLHLQKKSAPYLKDLIDGLRKAFLQLDASMIEINPVGINKNNELWVLDAKISFDDNALFRQPQITLLQDDCEIGERELQAKRAKFTYSEFDGNVGCIVNGDGLALSVMDLLKEKAKGAACFINLKGGVDKDKIANGIKIIMTNPKVEGILLNILGGFVRCNLIADGIVAAASEIGLNVPLVIRFEGTNKDIAKEIIENSRLPVIWAETLEDAVEKLRIEMERSA